MKKIVVLIGIVVGMIGAAPAQADINSTTDYIKWNVVQEQCAKWGVCPWPASIHAGSCGYYNCGYHQDPWIIIVDAYAANYAHNNPSDRSARLNYCRVIRHEYEHWDGYGNFRPHSQIGYGNTIPTICFQIL
jgi:hypothetical protein